MTWIERWRGIAWDPPFGATWLFLLLGAAVIAFAVIVYRRNEAPLPPGTRSLLTGLRALVLLMLVVLLCRPVLTMAVPGGAAHGILVLLDRSQSVTLPGRNPAETRDAELARAVAGVEKELGSRYPIAFRRFDRGLGGEWENGQPLPPPDGVLTDIASALERGASDGGPRGRPGALVLVSDGTQTAGEDPVPVARRLGIPIHTVALGSGDPVPDLALVRVRANPEAFAGEKTPVEAVVRLEGLPATTVQARLVDVTDGESELAEAPVSVTPGGAEQRVVFSFTPARPGLRFLEVRLPDLPGEATTADNRRLLSILVREEKTGVLLVSGALTWDHTFLERSLGDDSTLAVTSGFWKGNRFEPAGGSKALPAFTAPGLEGTRVVVLDHTSPRMLGSTALASLAAFVRQGGGLVVLTGGRSGDLSQWSDTPIGDILPVTGAGGSTEEETQVTVTPEGRRHALFDPTTPGSPPLDAWGALPPVDVPPDVGSLRGGAEALLARAGGGRTPVIAWNQAGAGRVILVAAGGVWRWGFSQDTPGSAGNVMSGWWRRAAHWLAQPGTEARFDIHAEKPVVSRGEPMNFIARVSDESYRPIPDVSVGVTLRPTAGGDTLTASLTGGDGFYRGGFDALPPGRYRFIGEARSDKGPVGSVDGTVVVDSLGAEMERLEADHELLERVASASGGKLWSPDSLDALGDTLQENARSRAERVQLALWDSPVFFILLVAAASLEWFLRRRRGLV